MEEKPSIQTGTIFRYIITGVSIALALFLLWYFKWVTIYILMGLVFSLIGRPVYVMLDKVKLGRVRLPNSIKAIFSLITIWAIVGGILALIVPMLINEGDRLSQINPEKVLKEMEQPLDKTIRMMEKYGMLSLPDSSGGVSKEIYEQTVIITIPCDSVDSAGNVVAYLVDTVEKHSNLAVIPDTDPADSTMTQEELAHKQQLEAMLSEYITKIFNFAQIKNFLQSIFGVISNLFIAIAASTFIAFFFLKDQNLFVKMVLTVVPERYERRTMIIMHESRRMLSRYFIGLVFDIFLVMTLVAVSLLMLGFNFETAITIGFFFAFFNIIPFVGPFIGGILGLLLAITHNMDMDFATQLYPLLVRMAIMFTIIHILDSNIFQTLIFSNSVNAHPLEIFLVILIAATLAGIPGMVFAVPAYTFLRIIARQFFTNFKLVRSLTRNM